MIPVFDTSVLINLEKRNKKTLDRLRDISLIYSSPVISMISYYEFLVGISKRKLKNMHESLEYINDFDMLHPNKRTAEILAELKVKYDKKGISLSLADMFIAAQVIENNMVLVTSDEDFNKIEELKKIII